MEDEWLRGVGGREGTEAPDGGADEVTSRVDELFTDAIDRQLAEQRALNRLVEGLEESLVSLRTRIEDLQRQVARDTAPTADRLAAVEAGLRSLREGTTSQSAGLRQEIQEALTRVDEDVRGRLEGVTEALTRLRHDAADRGASLEDVTRSVTNALERLDARQTNLADQLAELAARPEPVDPSEAVRELLEERLGRFTTEVAAELGEFAARVEDRVTSMTSRVGQLEERVSDQEDSGARAHAVLTGRLEELVAEVETRSAARVDDTLVRLQQDAEGRRADAEQVRAGFDGFAERVERLTEGVEQSRAAVTSHLAAVDDRLAVTEGHLERHGFAIGSLSGAVEQAVETVGSGVGEVRAAIEQAAAAFDRSAAEVRAAADRSVGAVETTSAESREELQRTVERARAAFESVLDEVREELGRSVELTASSLAAGLATVQSDVELVVEEGRRGNEQVLASFREQLRGDQRDELETLGEFVRGAVVSLGAELGELTDLRSTLVQGQALAGERMEEFRQDVLAALHERLGNGLAALEERLGSGLDEALGALGASLEAVTETTQRDLAAVRDTTEAAATGLVETAQRELSGARASTDDALEATRTAVAAELAAIRAAVADELGAVRQASEDEIAALRALLDERAAIVDDLVVRRLPELLEAHRETITGMLSRSLAEAEQRLESASGALHDANAGLGSAADRFGERVVDGVAHAVDLARDGVETVTADVQAAAARVDDVFRHLVEVEESLVAYLQERDRRTERERTAVLTELVRELAEGFSRRERRRLAGRVEAAQQRLEPPTEEPGDAAAEELAEAVPAGASRPGLLASLLEEEEVPVVPKRTGVERPDGQAAAVAAPVQPAPPPTQAPTPAAGPPATAGERATDEAATAKRATRKRAAAKASTGKRAAAKASTGKRATGKRSTAKRAASEHVCPECGFEARSAAGLAAHRRTHA